MRKLVATAVTLLALCSFASADVYIRLQPHTDPMTVMGQAQRARDNSMETWIGNDVSASVA